MTLIKSISGIRGTIGGSPGQNLTPVDAVSFAAAYGTFIQEACPQKKPTVVVGRDARISGPMIQSLVMQTLVGLGIYVIDLDLSTTPTVEMTVTKLQADGGIILTASHNPKQWNALKLLNANGEFLDGDDGQKILELVAKNQFTFAPVDQLGEITSYHTAIDEHIDAVLAHPLVNVSAIRKANFRVVFDGVNSVGGISIPPLLEQLGVECIPLYCDPTGHFPHNPEPLKEHLGDLAAAVVEQNAQLGIVVDPDVDRLAFMDENGAMFGEEYTLVAVADYVLQQTPGNTVSNLSSTRALRDVTVQHGGQYFASAVGEVNVVKKMKEVQAVIGGEGNGGIIDPNLHYGRDALVGVALFLTHLAAKHVSVSTLKKQYPAYFMSKQKIDLAPTMDVDGLLRKIEDKYSTEELTTIDGVKIDFTEEWVHLRKSNTEPIIRIYTEAKTQQKADDLAERFVKELSDLSCT